MFLFHLLRSPSLFCLNKTCKLINYETFMSFVFFVSKNYFSTVNNMKTEELVEETNSLSRIFSIMIYEWIIEDENFIKI